MKDKPLVLMVNEGTYPNTLGGVSTWCDTLIKALPEVNYHICCITSDPLEKRRYTLPANVEQCYNIPIWGTLDPHDYNFTKLYSKTFRNLIDTNQTVIEEKFIPLFDILLDYLFDSDLNAAHLGGILYKMHLYLQEYDLVATFRSRLVWENFKNRFIKAELQATGERPPLAEIAESLRILFRFLSILDYEVPSVDIVHATAAGISGLVCLVAKYKFNTPFLLTEHGVYLREQYLYFINEQFPIYIKKFIIKITETLVRLNYFLADAVSPVCEYNTRWEIKNGLSPEKIKVIYNGVNPEVFRPIPNLEATRPTVVSTVRIDPLKDIKTLIRSAAITKEKVPDVVFEIYGNVVYEDYYAECQQLVSELYLQDNVKFMGHTRNPVNVYNRGNVVALSSLSEAFPYTVIEAMMCGKPIIATNVGGVSEALQDVGLLVEPKNPEQLGQACISLLTDNKKANYYGQIAREKALSCFSINNTVTGYRNVYRELVDSGEVLEEVAAGKE